jgi:Domain of unknown function (DUF4232)
VRTAIPRCGGAVAALATVAVVAACGSSTSTSTSRSASRTVTTTTTVVSSSTPASMTASTTATTAPQARAATVPPGCTPAHTAVSVGQSGAATGHVGITLLFRNSGTAPCTLTGYPGATLVGPHRRLDVARTPQGFMGGLSPQARANPVVRLAAGGSASAVLEGEDFNPRTTGACPRFSTLLVTPPNQTVTVRLARSLAICDPQIHPLVAGETGRQGS